MSYDLSIVEPDHVPTSDEMYRVLEAWSDPTASPTIIEPRMESFWAELRARWSMSFGADACPWSIEPSMTERGPAVCGLAIRGSLAEATATALREPATRHGLIVYDPQRDKIVTLA